jgi:hypothetical protein
LIDEIDSYLESLVAFITKLAVESLCY